MGWYNHEMSALSISDWVLVCLEVHIPNCHVILVCWAVELAAANLCVHGLVLQ